MLLQLLEQKKTLLERNEVKSTAENLKRAYRVICHYERIKPAKIMFDNSLPENIAGQYIISYRNFIFIRIRTKNIILIKPEKNWLLNLFHEVTHQVLVNDIGYTGHGRNFNRLQYFLIKKYFDRIYNGLKEIENEADRK